MPLHLSTLRNLQDSISNHVGSTHDENQTPMLAVRSAEITHTGEIHVNHCHVAGKVEPKSQEPLS